MQTWIKICGITRVEDAAAALDAGADALGLNFIPSSKRYVSPVRAREIVDEVGGGIEWVGVVADESPESLRVLREHVGLDWLQLHGHESPADLQAVLPYSYKAARVKTAEDVAAAESFGGDRLLLDAKVEGELGGTGQTFDWGLIRGVVLRRAIILAGGLTPDNVAEAVARVRPFGVDTASGVESEPGKKDIARMRAFIEAARSGARS